MNASRLSVEGIVARVLELNVPVIVERSVKFTHGALLTRRGLVSFPKAALGASGLARFLHFVAGLGLPSRLAAQISADYLAAEVLHVGVEEERVFKVYLEFPQAEQGTGGAEDGLVFRAVKWDVAHPGSGGVSTYSSIRGPNADSMIDFLGHSFGARAAQAPGRFVLDLVARALSRDPSECPVLLEVEDQGTPRRSFDVNLYDFGLTLADAAPDFPGLAEHFLLSADEVQDLARLPQAAAIGHLALGVARDGREFLTVFYGGGAP